MWQRPTDIANQIRNMVRRGYLLATYTDGKILRARVKTGEAIENDRLDVAWPVGFAANVKAGPKVEVLTLDVGGDPSRRLVLTIFGDREQVPVAEDGEAFFYTPGDKTRFIRFKSGGGNGAATRAGERPAGLEINTGNIPITMKTEKHVTMDAPEGVKFAMRDQVFEGNVWIKGNLVVEGSITVGGSISASSINEGPVTPPAPPNIGG